jgi:hypothetical protein
MALRARRGPMLFNLILAGFWLVAGMLILLWPYLTGRSVPPMHLFGSDFSPAWLVFFFVAYNLSRWYTVRSLRIQRQGLDEAWRQRRRPDRVPKQEAEEPNPTFDFRDPPGAGPA